MPYPFNYLCYAAKCAKAGKSNFNLVVRNGKLIAQGPDLRDVVKGDVAGGTLYSFCEPSMEELLLASAAGIKEACCGISKQDAVRHGLVPLALKKPQHARETILTEYVETWNEFHPT
jgi:hypothetical protein